MACQQVRVYVCERERRRKKREGLAIGDGRKRVNMPVHVKEGEGIKSKEEERDCTMHIDSIINLVELHSTIMPPTKTLLLFKIACTENQIILKPMEFSSVSYYVY